MEVVIVVVLHDDIVEQSKFFILFLGWFVVDCKQSYFILPACLITIMVFPVLILSDAKENCISNQSRGSFQNCFVAAHKIGVAKEVMSDF